MKKNLFLFLICLVLPVVVQAGIPKYLARPFFIQESETPTEVSPFKLANPQGKLVTLDDYKGKLLLLNFWATWCPPCVRELPDFEKLLASLKGENFAVLGINIMESKKRVTRFISKKGMTLPVALDLKGESYPAYLVQSFPTTVIINKNGREIGRVVGIRNWASPQSINFFRNLSRRD